MCADEPPPASVLSLHMSVFVNPYFNVSRCQSTRRVAQCGQNVKMLNDQEHQDRAGQLQQIPQLFSMFSFTGLFSFRSVSCIPVLHVFATVRLC